MLSFAVMYRQWISIVFLALMLGQLMPVKQVGNFLYNNQLLEEICDAGTECDDFGKHSKEGSEKSDCISPFLLNENHAFSEYLADFQFRNEYFLSRHGDDVLTPPPLA